MRIVFEVPDTKEVCGIMDYRLSNRLAYLMDKGYVSFQDAEIRGDDIVSAYLVWNESYDPEKIDYAKMLTIRKNLLANVKHAENDENDYVMDCYIVDTVMNGYKIHNAFLLCEDSESNPDLDNKMMKSLYEPGNSVSYKISNSRCGDYIGILEYVGENTYAGYDPYECGSLLSFRIDGDKIYCIDRSNYETREYLLNGIDAEYALYLINNYRHTIFLPPICLNHSKEEI